MKVRTNSQWTEGVSETVGNQDYDTDIPSLYAGPVLEEHDDADSPFGLREQPLG